MSVKPVSTDYFYSNIANRPVSQGNFSKVGFEELLSKASSAADGGEVSAKTAAEVLRLSMLTSAIGITADQDQQKASSGNFSTVQGLLNKFIAQLPVNSSQVSGSSAVSNESISLPKAINESNSIDGLINKASQQYGIDAGLIKAVIKAESNFNPNAVSSAGAQGLMQLMPSTARGLGVKDSFDPEQNVMAGTRFLKDMMNRYSGNIDDTLAAYNWGPGNVDKHGTDRLPKETREYLSKVKTYYAQYVA